MTALPGADAPNVFMPTNFPCGPSQRSQPNPLAASTATRAVTLDPTLPEAHVALGAVLAFYEWNWSEGEKEFQRALELNPNLSLAHHWYAQLLDGVGRYEEALKHRQRAAELRRDPAQLEDALASLQDAVGPGTRSRFARRWTIAL